MPTVHISEGNIKLGTIPSVSLPPILTCNRCAGCAKTRKGNKAADCFADRMQRRRASIRKSWARNFAALRADAGQYFAHVSQWISRKRPFLFRWHVGGDCPNRQYLADVIRTAKANPDTAHMMFTKRYDWLPRNPGKSLPPNLTIIASAWPGLDMPAWIGKAYPTAWMRDERMPDNRIPSEARECSGNCQSCGALCWHLRAGQSVVFDKH